MNNLQVSQGAAALQFNDPGVVNTIRSTVAKGASDHELQMFLHLCNQYQLDPFRKEIWFIKYGGEPTIMTSRDGYLKIAQQSPDFEGIMSQEVRDNDFFEMDPASGTVTHRFAQPMSKRGKIVGAWATAHRKGVKPVSIFVNYDEYKGPDTDRKGKPTIWKKYPSAMIIKVAEAFVLKRQFGITGLVTREELDGQAERENVTQGQYEPQNKQENAPPPKTEPADTDLVPTNKDIDHMRQCLGWEPDKMAAYINAVLEKNGQQPSKWPELSPTWKINIYNMLQKRLDKMMEEAKR